MAAPTAEGPSRARWRLVFAAALLAATWVVASHAAAQPPRPKPPAASEDQPARKQRSPWDRLLAAELTMGVGTPTGMTGLHLEMRLARAIAVRAGIGGGMIGDPQAAAMTRLRFPELPALNLGVGISAGSYREACGICSDPSSLHWDLALWNNYELSVETRSWGGFMFRVFGGAGVLVNRAGYHCNEICESDDVREIPIALPYLGVGVGAVFDG